MSNTDFTYRLSLRIFSGEKFFGAGVAQLLEGVDETGSLLKSCQKMSMAYTKALKMIQRAEKALGSKLLVRKAGGASGGGSYLTENAEKLLKSYRQLEKNVLSYTDKEFKTFLNEIGEAD